MVKYGELKNLTGKNYDNPILVETTIDIANDTICGLELFKKEENKSKIDKAVLLYSAHLLEIYGENAGVTTQKMDGMEMTIDSAFLTTSMYSKMLESMIKSMSKPKKRVKSYVIKTGGIYY